MGQKVNPIGLRTGPYREWSSVMYANKDYAKKLQQNLKTRSLIMEKYKSAQVGNVIIKHYCDHVGVTICTRRPGVIIGKGGVDVASLEKKVSKIFNTKVRMHFQEIKDTSLSAFLVAQTIAQQLRNRAFFKRSMKTAIQNCMKFKVKGIKIACSGRLGGAEIARTEWYIEGRVPLHTIRANIDYGFAEAETTYGVIGIKVWIYRGEY